MPQNGSSQSSSLAHLLPDYSDDPGTILPSFPFIRQKTLDTLYPASQLLHNHGNAHAPVDKSPKGSVDAPIQHLVDLINHHPSFATLSSCSGRVALFDPNLVRRPQHSATVVTPSNVVSKEPVTVSCDSDENDICHQERHNSHNSSGALDSGKGSTGGWLFVSHEQIDDPSVVLQHLWPTTKTGNCHSNKQNENENQSADFYNEESTISSHGDFIYFKLEPFLLHVAAGSLSRAQQLLQISLRLGLRESGLIVTDKRVTVAIRSTCLALTVPLSQSMRQPSYDYMESLIQLANERLQQNQNRLERLYQEIKCTLFQDSSENSAIFSSNSYCIELSPLPDLNLWNHAAVVVPRNRIVGVTDGSLGDTQSVDVIVFGGYGHGPDIVHNEDDKLSILKPANRPQRSDNVYRLGRNQHGVWDEKWSKVVQIESSVGALGLKNTINFQFTARQGSAACLVTIPSDFSTRNSDSSVSTILLFGGRQGPAVPLADLLLCTYTHSNTKLSSPHIEIQTCKDVQGKPPSPRWGHTFTALSGRNGRLAVLVGGRNEKIALSDVFVLSRASKRDSEFCLLWETVLIGQETVPRFHHAAVAVQDQLFVFGGLSNVNELLSPFTNDAMFSESRAEKCVQHSLPPIAIDFCHSNSLMSIKNSTCSLLPLFHDFGHAMCCLSSEAAREESNIQHTSKHSAQTTSQESSSGTIFLCLSSGGLSCNLESETDGMSNNDLKIDSPFKLMNIRRDRIDNLDISWEIIDVPIEHIKTQSSPSLGGTFIHQACLSIPTSKRSQDPNSYDVWEACIVGGGVMGFGFRECYTTSYNCRITRKLANTNDMAVTSQKRLQRIAPAKPLINLKVADGDAKQTRVVPELTDVVYVFKEDAKALKEQLESLSYLNKTFRMCPAQQGPASAEGENTGLYIAVPVTKQCVAQLNINTTALTIAPPVFPWFSLVKGRGKQTMPLSTSAYARQKRI